VIPLGAGPFTTDPRALESRTREAIAETLGIEPHDVVVEWTGVAGDVVDALAINFSGASVDITQVEQWSRSDASSSGRPDSAGGTVLRSVILRCQPVHVFGAPITAHVEAVNVPARWSRDTADRLWLVLDDSGPLTESPRGRVQVAGDTQAVASAAARAVIEVAALLGLGARDVQVEPSSAGRNHVRLDLRATLSKGLLRSRVTGHAMVAVDGDLVLHVSSVDAAVSGVFGRIARPHIDGFLAPWRDARIPLGEQIYAGAAVTSFEIDVDPMGRFRGVATFGG
jgi:hypothetical protein